jgi:hypothetical protein
MSNRLEYETPQRPAKVPGDAARRIGDVWQRFGASGAPSGTSGEGWKTFLAALAVAAVVAGLINFINVITTLHEEPRDGLLGPLIWEGSSWLTLMAVLWIPFLAWRIAPLTVRPRWRLALHLVAAPLFSLAHVLGFVALRALAYWLYGASYHFGAFWPHFLYEFSKDGPGYVVLIAGFSLIARLFVVPAPRQATFDIRDGARITRVPVADILAIASAGNYVEFVLRDGRRLLMRSPLSALESELGPHGFVRTHRSWLVNAMQMTALEPEGSGDYTVKLSELSVPLSRRFPEALAKLRAA